MALLLFKKDSRNQKAEIEENREHQIIPDHVTLSF